MRKIASIPMLLLAITTLVAQKNSDIPVTSAISDYDSTSTAYHVQSDGLYGGVYSDGQAGVTSILQGGTYWELDTYNSGSSGSSGRNALITLNPAINQAFCSGCTAPTTPPSIFGQGWGTYLEPVRFIVRCCSCPSLQTIKPGSPMNCPLLIKFGPIVSSSKNTTTHYRLDMDNGSPSYETEVQQPLISCNAQNSSGNCVDWSIDSIPPTGQNGGVLASQVIARLVLVTSSGTLLQNLGDFYLTFHIHVTNP